MARTKDVVLMATVSSFENMVHPSRHELRQFAELFEPVFRASSMEARRNAVAALSGCPTMPRSVAWFLATQPIDIAAIFIGRSPALDDDTLIAVARTHGPTYAKAIAARENLSVKVVDALVALHQGQEQDRRDPADLPDSAIALARLAAMREEQLRQTIKALVQRDALVRTEEGPEQDERVQHALLIRFARLGDAHSFAITLADAMGSSHWLSQRIMLDLSGLQLATALIAIEISAADGEFMLARFYPHLKEMRGEMPRAATLWASLDAHDCADRVHAWMRADDYTQGKTDDAHAANVNDAVAEPVQRPAFARARSAARR
ncbi:DUF2336 domain-containing protein [Rhizobium setariae]|nr:DUF2336 domain-containing protein [Rhizobium setariae]